MTNNSPKPDNRHARKRNAASQSGRVGGASAASRGFSYRATGCLILLGSLLAYLFLFLRQPSLFGLSDADGEPFDRFVDLLVMPGLAGHFLGDGSLSIAVWDRVPILLAGLAWLGLAVGIGWPVIKGGLSGISRPESFAIAALVGLALLSTTTLLVGWAGALGHIAPLAISIGVLGVGCWLLPVMLGRFAAPSIAVPPDGPSRASGDAAQGAAGDAHAVAGGSVGSLEDVVGDSDAWLVRHQAVVWLARLVPVATCLLAAIYLWGSCLPAWEFDVVEYHMQAPKEFYQAGKIDFVSHNVYANMPLGVEMHTLAAMMIAREFLGAQEGWWWGALVGKVIVASYSLLAAAVLGGFIARHCGRWAGWSAAGLLLAVPGHVHVALSGLIDGALGAYCLAVIVVLSCLDIPRGAANTATRSVHGLRIRRILLIASVLAGAAAATKYPGLVFSVIPLGLVAVYQLAKFRSASTWGWGLAAVLLGLALTCLPWYLKNATLTGNPVYPLAYGLFGGSGLDEASALQWSEAHRPGGSNARNVYSPGRLLDSLSQLTYASPFVNPAVIFLAACSIVFGWRRGRDWFAFRQERQDGSPSDVWQRYWWLSLLWILAVWWLATHRIDRFWLPAVPLLAGLAASSAVCIGRWVSASLSTAVVLGGLVYGVLTALSGASQIDNRFLVPLAELHQQARDESQPGLVSPLTVWCNANLEPQASKLLLIGEAKAFDFEAPILYATCFNENPGEKWLRGQVAESQLKALRQGEVTHVVVNWQEIERYRSPGNYGFSAWPTRADTEQWLTDAVVEEVDTGLDPRSVQVFRVQ
ncbi:hypothetical protein [Aureliella helgolandensis]|uniref:Glycosyltransferase RgtA/B/C/D-like domain-containing protein n=1 Tax=Aureliella helgolandensis TaxID=2527968 RepID=A0A518GGQ2_9BACT|nr:hypothetical protein [Aureliella helgolandensis]QDV27753.1 hypothetical protein Q31a_61460 [Aureliella helgolandensis]